MLKTVSFATVHFSIATLVAYALTQNFLLSSLLALIEPSVNTVAFYFHEKIWQQHLSHWQKYIKVKTLSFACVHFTVAFSVVALLSGSWIVGGLVALIEPSLNSLAYYFHERLWQRQWAYSA